MAQELLRKTIKAASTEETVSLPLFVTRVRVFNRSLQAARISFKAGEVAGGGTRVTRNNPYDSGFLNNGATVLYVAADMPGVILEVFAEFYEARESGAFSSGFSTEFA